MSGEDKTRPMPVSGSDATTRGHDGDHLEHRTRAQIDEEIAALEERSRRHTQTLEPPPELPPAPARKALVIVGVSLVVLLVAGAITVIGRESHERALAKEKESSKIQNFVFVHPLAEQHEEE